MARVEPFRTQQSSARAFFHDDFDIAQTVAKSLGQPIENPDDFFSNFLVSQ